MDANVIMQLISNMGFPIVCCGALFYYIVKKDRQHLDEVGNLSRVVESNTLIIQKLVDSLERMGDK